MEPELLICLACGTGMSLLWLWEFRQRLAVRVYAMLPIALLHTVLGVLCVSLFAGLESFRLTISGGMSLYGAIFLLPLCYWLGGRLFRRDLRHVFDVMTLCMISTLAFARINCIISGCCRGLLLPGSNVLYWPTREAEMLFHIILLVLFARRLRRQEQPGTIYPIYMMCYGIFRFIIEWFRAGNALFWGLHPAHFWSLLSVIIGWSIYTVQVQQSTFKKNKTTHHKRR